MLGMYYHADICMSVIHGVCVEYLCCAQWLRTVTEFHKIPRHYHHPPGNLYNRIVKLRVLACRVVMMAKQGVYIYIIFLLDYYFVGL